MKKIIFEGSIKEITYWLYANFGQYDTISLKEIFGEDVIGVFKPEEKPKDNKYQYYYQYSGEYRYIIFQIV